MNVDRKTPRQASENLSYLKNRHTGFVGQADELQYNRETGRLTATDSNFGF